MMTGKLKTWTVSFAVSGTGNARVEAATLEEAEAKAKAGDFSDEPEIDNWDINDSGYRGGYIEVYPEPEA